MGKGPEQTFFKEDIQMTNRHIKRHSALLTIREMEIKTTRKCHLTPVRMAVIKKTRGNKCLKDAEEKRSPCTVVELGKTVWRLLKKLKNTITVMHEYLVVSDSLQPHGLQPASLLCPWDSTSKNTGVGCHLLLRGIFPTQASNRCLLHLLHCGQILYC